MRPDTPCDPQEVMLVDVEVVDEDEDLHGGGCWDEWHRPKTWDSVGYLSCLSGEGHSVMVRVTGFKPWLYIRIPRGRRGEQIKAFYKQVEDVLAGHPGKVGPVGWSHKHNLVGWEPGPGGEGTYRPIYGKVYFRSMGALRRAATALRRRRMDVFEDQVPAAHKLCCAHGFTHTGWLRIHSCSPVEWSMSSAQHEVECKVGSLVPLAIDRIAPLVLASFDLECHSRDGGFPEPAKPSDPIIQIGISVQRFGEAAPCQRIVLCLGATDPIEAAEIRCFDSERALLDGFVHCMVDELDADVLLGYNVFNFDFSYLAERMLRLQAFSTYTPADRSLARSELRDLRQLRRLRGRGGPPAGSHLSEPLEAFFAEAEPDWKDDGAPPPEEGWPALLAAVGRWPELPPLLDSPWARDYRIESMADRLKYVLAETEDAAEWFEYAAAQAGEPALWRMDRRRGGCTLLTEKPMANAASGANLLKLFQLRGRVVFDLYQYVKTNHKLPSYKLDAVAEHFVGERKVDLSPKRMFELYRQDAAGRAEVAAYCIQDCDLPLRIMQHLQIVPALVELSRVTCTDLSDIITRGQQIKVYNLFTTFANEKGYVVNKQELQEFEACPYTGAVVLEPKAGFYNCPISTLDFASLYPSIMQSENLCYASLVRPSRLAAVRALLGERMGEVLTEYIVEGESFWIVKATTQRGVLPQILERILAQRKLAKRAMKEAADPDEKARQNARQLALKVSANSCYGFFGVKKGMLPCLPIAALTTSVGRAMLGTAARRVLELFPGSEVIYGDTDSVMVKFPVEASMAGVRKSFELGERASAEISKCFPPPHDLEMEKVYFPYVLLNKKRYAGMQFSHPEDSEGSLDTKGLENVRRDTCAMLRTAYGEVQEAALRQRSEAAMLAALRRWCERLRRRAVPLEQLVQSKQLGAHYASNNLPHVALAERLKRRIREDGLHQEPPRSGDRIDFLIVHRAGATRLFEKSEDPQHVAAHQLELDYEYYLLKQLWAPIERFIQPFPPAFVASCTKLVQDALRDIRNQHQRQNTIQTFFRPAEPAAKRQCSLRAMFGGDRMGREQ